jgi:uncharacterized protein YqfA (UPF0365 family)
VTNENSITVKEELENFHKNFKKIYTKGIRSQTLYNLILIDVALQFKLDNIKEEMDYDIKEVIGFNEYIRQKERLKDIENILGCSERTARDYRDALAHFHQ